MDDQRENLKPGEAPSEALVFTRRSLREIDRLAAERYGLPTLVLMENAGRHVADVARELLSALEHPRVLIAAGPGNNGGDGLVAARHLANSGARVVVVVASPEGFKGDALTNFRVVRAMGLPIVTPEEGTCPIAAGSALLGGPDLVIDALLGTGLTREVTGLLRTIIRAIDELHRQGVGVLSIDVPSGLDADSGRPLGAAITADVTVTLVGPKVGFGTLDAQPYVGEVVVADIGIPAACIAELGEPPPPAPASEYVDDVEIKPPARPPRAGGRRA
ncbi:MAG: NAD(P)H-hydrate epimerase [Phycisphaeraceae bacterium]|nr:NAD(P)H-hydrate epimerase [Phycisphaeraceae bacterium]MCW5755454.1 NAD(P)H-hydrate epimerase [Phycisphaeraceae bacterium]